VRSAELFGRQTVEETQQFLAALMEEVRKLPRARIVVWVVRAAQHYVEVLASQRAGARLPRRIARPRLA